VTWWARVAAGPFKLSGAGALLQQWALQREIVVCAEHDVQGRSSPAIRPRTGQDDHPLHGPLAEVGLHSAARSLELANCNSRPPRSNPLPHGRRWDRFRAETQRFA